MQLLTPPLVVLDHFHSLEQQCVLHVQQEPMPLLMQQRAISVWLAAIVPMQVLT